MSEWTKEQRGVIEARGVNLLVSASAGSGKTTVMIERIVALLREGHSLKNMLVSTFTRAAAEDMRAKLFSKLSECKGDARLAAELEYLPQADISTLHSWCQRIIKTYFYAADVDPDFEIIDESAAAAMLTDCIDTVLSDEAERGDADFLLLYDVMLYNRKDKALRTAVRAIYEFAVSQPDPDGWLDRSTDGYKDDGDARAYLAGLSEARLTRLTAAARDLVVRTEAAGFTRNLPFVSELEPFLNGRLDALGAPRGKVEPAFVDLNLEYQALKKEAKTFREAEDARGVWDGENSAAFAAVLVRLARRLKELYREGKRRKAQLDYNDLEHYAYEILSDEDALAAIRSRYRFVFVDEYQDINPLQESIVSRVATDGGLFLVGDVKQSIYAFRRCDPQIFVDKYQSYSGGINRTVDLNANFRSDERILDFCNRVFDGLMTPQFGRVDYRKDARLVSGRGDLGGSVVMRVAVAHAATREPDSVYSVLGHDYDDEELTLVEAETNLIVGRVFELMLSSVPENGGTRPARLSDIVILVRSMGALAASLCDKLRRAGVEVRLGGKLRPEAEIETRPLVAYLRLIDNRFDDVSLAAVMRSYFGGFGDNELAAVRRAYPAEEQFYRAVALYAEGTDALAGKLRAFFATLDRYTELSHSMRADELAGLIVAESQYFKYVFSLPGGDGKADNLTAYLSHLSACPYRDSVPRYISYLDREEPELSVAAGGDAVRIMTIHASKGLEFPFVILADTAKRFNLRDTAGKLILDPRFGLCLKHWDLDRREIRPTALWRAASESVLRRTLEEEMRVLYVALTRAKLSLSIFGAVGDRNNPFLHPKYSFTDAAAARNYLTWLAPAAGFAEFYPAEECAAETRPQKSFVLSAGDPALTAKIKDRIDFVYDGAHRPLKTNVTRLAGEEDDGIVYVAGGETDDRAAERGTAYHKAMELIDFGDIEGSLPAALSAAGALADSDKIRRAAQKTAALADGRRVYREKSFVYNAPDGEGGRVLIQGVVDLLLTRGREAVVVDYKTTKRENLLTGAYKKQLALYAEAVREILGFDTCRTLIYSFELDDFLEIGS